MEDIALRETLSCRRHYSMEDVALRETLSCRRRYSKKDIALRETLPFRRRYSTKDITLRKTLPFRRRYSTKTLLHGRCYPGENVAPPKTLWWCQLLCGATVVLQCPYAIAVQVLVRCCAKNKALTSMVPRQIVPWQCSTAIDIAVLVRLRCQFGASAVPVLSGYGAGACVGAGADTNYVQ